MTVYARILGTGSRLPSRAVSNADLERMVDTSDEWIVQRTGIRSRFILGEDEQVAGLGVAAAEEALRAAGRSAEDIDLLIVATNFPEMILPGTSPFIAAGIGLRDSPFFDIKAGCSGFVYGMAVADGLLRSGVSRCLLLVGIEALSRMTDWTDRKTCVLFGDGAGAVVMERADGGQGGILGASIHGDHDKAMLLHMPAGGTRTPASHETVDQKQHVIKMEGAGVYRSAVSMMARASLEALDVAGLTLDEVDWLIPHQANLRIIESLVRRTGINEERVIVNLDRVANTSTASIPIALDEAVRDGRIGNGDRVLLTAFGAGACFGAVVAQM